MVPVRRSIDRVVDLRGQDRAATREEVERLLESVPDVEVLAVVQGEALTGLFNPIDAITEAAAQRGVTVMIDSVSSVGAEPFTPAKWGRAISVLGTQKGLGGPSGLSVAVVEKSLWDRIEANPSAPRRSFLSLLDIKHNWLDTGRRAFFGMPSAEEMALMRSALLTAVDRGIAAIEREHELAKVQARAHVRAIPGLTLTVADAEASGVSTTLRLDAPELEREPLLEALAQAGVTSIKTAPDPRNLRWGHYGADATPERVEAAAAALAAACSVAQTEPAKLR